MSNTPQCDSRSNRQDAVDAIEVAIHLCWDAYHFILRAHELGAEAAALRAESRQVRRCSAAAGARRPGAPPLPALRIVARSGDSALTPR
jgi:hypothetical protein